MCPDRQILSLYLDGELPSPWREKMEDHLGSCAACREHLDAYRGIHAALVDADPAAALDGARERVWARLEAGRLDTGRFDAAVNAGRLDAGPLRAGGINRLWRRRVSLPAAAAAALAAGIAAAVGVAAFNAAAAGAAARGAAVTTAPAAAPAMPVTGGVDVASPETAADMASVLRYLSREDTADYMIIRLPESRAFSSYGEPALIRAADYAAPPPRGAGQR